MSSSPFEIFRRNLKPLMVLLTGLAMFAFVVLPVLDSYMRRGVTGGGDEVVASFDGVELTRGRIDYFTRNHNSTVRFLRELAEATIARNGYPRTAGFVQNEQTGRIESIGINEAPSVESTIRTIQFAHLANQSGFALDDVAIQTWLEQFTDAKLSDSEINGLLVKATNYQMGQYHLYDQLRTQLLADLYVRSAFASLIDGRMPMLTPAEQWDTFLKLNRQATIDAYGVLASDFLDETDPTPGEPEIAAVYDQGKDRDPSDQSPEPAFHRRYSAKFEYLVGDYPSLLAEEMDKLTEEQLRAEYQRRLEGGDFKLPDQMPAETPADAETPAPTDNEAPAETDTPAETEAPADTEASAETETPAATETPADTKTPAETDAPADTETPADTEASADTDAPAEDDAEPAAADSGEDADSADAADPATGEDEATDESKQSLIGNADHAIRLVALQDQDDEAPQEPADTQEPADSQEQPATTDDRADAAAEPADDPAEEPAEEPAQPDDAAAAPSSDSAEAEGETGGEAADSEAGETPAVESFEDVRDRIAEDLAGPIARRRLDQAVQQLITRMRRYFSERAIYDSKLSIGQEADPPAELDLAALGEELGFTYEVIGPYDEFSINDEPISQSRELGSEMMSRGPSFGMMMYGVEGGMNPIAPQPLYAPLSTTDDQTGRRYVSWKIAETEAYTPPLEEVRDEVVMYIRMREARKLALARAEELAKQASASDKPLEELIPEDKRANLEQGLGPFSWLDQIGFQGATIGNVPELDSVGDEFMKTVFTTEVGQYGVATNQPERVAYVVKPTGFQPAIEELRRRFKEPTGRMMATFIGGSENNSVIQGFYQAVDEATGFQSKVMP